MFSIYDGRSYFYQWDLDRKLIVNDETIKEVHFCNKTDECSLVCEVYKENGTILVNVPNILLQDNWKINVYGYDVNFTKHADSFEVKRRSKPADYVYTETEVKNWESLSERIDQIEQNGVSDETINNAVGKYLEENPVEVDLTGYATETFVNDAIGAIEIPSIEGLATETYVDNKISAIPKTDLSNYYTKQETDKAISNSKQDLTPYALKKDIPSVEGLATEKYVDDSISNIDIPEVDLTNYATKDYVTEEVAKVATGGEVDLSSYATKVYVDEAIEAIPEVDLTSYALKTELPSIEGLATEEYVNSAIEGIDIPDTDLSNYYTKAETNTAINNAKQDLTPYALKTDIPSINGLASETYVDNAVNNKVSKDSVVNNFVTTEEGFIADARALKVLNDKIFLGPDIMNISTHTTLTNAVVTKLTADKSGYYRVTANTNGKAAECQALIGLDAEFNIIIIGSPTINDTWLHLFTEFIYLNEGDVVYCRSSGNAVLAIQYAPPKQ